MTEKEYDALNKEEVKAMLKEIDNNYKDLSITITPKYNKDGEITNEKQVKNQLKKLAPLLLIIWAKNLAITTKRSTNVMVNTNLYINTIKKAKSKGIISKLEWNKIVNKAVKDRAKKVKINQVIKGNAKVLNKKVQNTVKSMYKDGKNKNQIANQLKKEFGYNKNKAKSIAITEKNYYKSEAQLKAIDSVKQDVKKIWVHNSLAKVPRDSHIAASGQVADKDGYFTVGGNRTQAPQHFGIASEDINCHCTMRIE